MPIPTNALAALASPGMANSLRAAIPVNSLAVGPTDPQFYIKVPSPKQILSRNMAYARPNAGGYMTQLSPDEERAFQTWVRKNNVPFDPSPYADYDMRGFFKGLISGDPHASSGVNQNDNRLHFSDWWKTPYHMSFSRESQWATPNAPSWNEQDQLVLPNGTIVFDERALAKSRGGR